MKSCVTCKYLHSGECKSRDFQKAINIQEYSGAIDFIEEGIFHEQILESGIVEALVKEIIEQLDADGFIKKTKDTRKFMPDDDRLVEIIDDHLSGGIQKYFDKTEFEILIDEPREFKCEFWE